MLKAKTILALFGIALSFSFLVLCFMTFVVLPNDVLRKSSFYRTRGLPLGQQRPGISRQKVNSLLKTNNTEGRFAIRHVVEIDGESKKLPAAKMEELPTDDRRSDGDVKPRKEFPLLRVRPGHNKMGDDAQVDRILLAKTLRDHGMHPERARALIAALLDKDEKH
ncbi:uncharacterized protein [Macrobrachium rosenbergii]|uniref:uncharacterized protein n=1 Tax=Macrobrachium rosenbergii TaxID=79674 RepID=UPI0034D524E2